MYKCARLPIMRSSCVLCAKHTKTVASCTTCLSPQLGFSASTKPRIVWALY